MLAIGLPRTALEAGHRVYFYCGPLLLVIDEFVYARHNPDPEANTVLFEMISRYLKSSTIVTSHVSVALRPMNRDNHRMKD